MKERTCVNVGVNKGKNENELDSFLAEQSFNWVGGDILCYP